MSEERCIMCGEIIPEGRQVCKRCEISNLDKNNTTKFIEVVEEIIEKLKSEKINYEECVSTEDVKMVRQWNSAINRCIRCIEVINEKNT